MSSKVRHFLLLLAVLLLGVGCGYDSHTDPTVEFADPTRSATIAELREMASENERVPEGVVVVGRVTANDRDGNFYQRIVVEDSSGAVEVLLGLYDLAALYPVGALVAVHCEGLVTDEYNGVLQLGAERYEWSDYRLEPIATRREIEQRVEVCGTVERLEPLEVTSLRVFKESDLGRLVRIRGARVEEVDEDWGTTEYGTEADRVFLLAEGEKFAVRTSLYSDFATEPIPLGELTLTGILYSDRVEGEEMFVLKLRSRNDVE